MNRQSNPPPPQFAELAQQADQLEERTPEAILGWALERFPKITFATGFGVEGCVLLDVIGRAQLPIDLFTLDTGLLFPETHALWAKLETRYNINIRSVRPSLSLDEQDQAYGARLWERDPDRCCELRKVLPLSSVLSGFDAWVTSIRREQTFARAAAQIIEWDAQFGLAKVNPLIHWTSRDIWARIQAHQIPYNPLHARGYPSIGCLPCTSPVLPGEDPRAGRWRGRSKVECGIHLSNRRTYGVGGSSEVEP